MAFQTQAYSKQALGSAGEISKAFHSFCNVETAIAADENCCVGCFVQTKSGSTNENEVIGASGVAINGNVVGVVVKTNYINSEKATCIYKKGDNLSIITAGSVFIEVDNAKVEKGKFVFLKNDSGTLVFDDKMVKAGHTFTGWVVSKGNAEAKDGVIEITTAQANTFSKIEKIQA